MGRIDQKAFIDFERAAYRNAHRGDRSSERLRVLDQFAPLLNDTGKSPLKGLRGLRCHLDPLQDLPSGGSFNASGLGPSDVETKYTSRAVSRWFVHVAPKATRLEHARDAGILAFGKVEA